VRINARVVKRKNAHKAEKENPAEAGRPVALGRTLLLERVALEWLDARGRGETRGRRGCLRGACGQDQHLGRLLLGGGDRVSDCARLRSIPP
jgi:hypothetical protein